MHSQKLLCSFRCYEGHKRKRQPVILCAAGMKAGSTEMVVLQSLGDTVVEYQSLWHSTVLKFLCPCMIIRNAFACSAVHV